MAKNPLHHVGGHLLDQIHRVIQEHLAHHLVQLLVAETAHQNLLGVAVHIGKGIRCQFLRQQAEQDGHALFRQILQQGRRISRVDVLDQGGNLRIFFLFQKL